MPELHQDEILVRHLRAFFSDLDSDAIGELHRALAWVEIPGGATLMTQGEAGDSMFVAISGRLRAYVADEDGSPHRVREMGRGQIIGEMSLYTGAPRSATVVAIRDSRLARLAKADFDRLLTRFPQISIALTRRIIERLQAPPRRSDPPIVMGVVPISTGVDTLAFATKLAAKLAAIGNVRVVDAASLDAGLGRAGIAESADDDAESARRVARYLDEIEATHDFVLLVGNERPSVWLRRCIQGSDELLLLADAARAPALHETEIRYLVERPGRSEAAEILVLLHPREARCPRGTREWLDRRPVADHVHVRIDNDRDIARLARLQTHTAVGLVLGGGGARGLAHLGVVRALEERGIDIDCVGGTSIGAIMASLVASDQPAATLLKIARRGFAINPTGDFNLLPLLSLLKGRRLRRLIAQGLDDLLGFDADVEDLWKGFYCIASNYSQAQETPIHRGSLIKALLASIAIPGALPPVVRDGDLLCDGGTFNNFPVDVMRDRRGIGRVIGVDLGVRKQHRIEAEDVPSNWQLLRDRLRRRERRRYRYPSLTAYLVNVTVLYSASRRREAQRTTDLYFNPPLSRVGMLEWRRFDSIVEQGYAHAIEVLERLAQREAAHASGLKAVEVAQQA